MSTDGNNGNMSVQTKEIVFSNVEAYCQVAATSLLVYDIIITFEKEVKYFWTSPRKLSSWVFFLNRYIGLFAAIIAGMIGILLIDYILLLRVLAFFSGDRRIARGLSALFVLEAVLMFAILLYIEISLKVGLAFANGVSECGSNGEFQQIWATLYWVVPLIHQEKPKCNILNWKDIW
ncbi:hypothetical protein DFH11DRAFT_1250428 [Phellopilus nigrolimitatus]|nr:hypothetical protein DFH11DRAFT_1250428 [Phellopilus nigrolimitatus]